MTETQTETGVIHREFPAELSVTEGRTVDVRIVPYGERITHNDGLGDMPRGVDYQEEWLPGVFSHQVNAANRVHANFEHQAGVGNVVGHGLQLRDTSDGFHGSFVLHETEAGKTALALIQAGSLDGVSLEAVPVKNVRAGGVIQRVKANLHAIAFTRFAAYDGAKVLAVREEAVTIDADLLPLDMDPDLVERLRRVGTELPARYEAHPAETGTPAESGTPEDGTRQTTGNRASEVPESEHNTE